MKTTRWVKGAALLATFLAMSGCGAGTYQIPNVEPVVKQKPEEDELEAELAGDEAKTPAPESAKPAEAKPAESKPAEKAPEAKPPEPKSEAAKPEAAKAEVKPAKAEAAKPDAKAGGKPAGKK